MIIRQQTDTHTLTHTHVCAHRGRGSCWCRWWCSFDPPTNPTLQKECPQSLSDKLGQSGCWQQNSGVWFMTRKRSGYVCVNEWSPAVNVLFSKLHFSPASRPCSDGCSWVLTFTATWFTTCTVLTCVCVCEPGSMCYHDPSDNSASQQVIWFLLYLYLWCLWWS